MNTLDVVTTGTLGLLGLILLMLIFHYLRLRGIWQALLVCRTATRWARLWEMENRELRSALRAEKAHVEQLQGKLTILQSLISVD